MCIHPSGVFQVSNVFSGTISIPWDLTDPQHAALFPSTPPGSPFLLLSYLLATGWGFLPYLVFEGPLEVYGHNATPLSPQEAFFAFLDNPRCNNNEHHCHPARLSDTQSTTG